MIQVSNLEKAHGKQVLFDKVGFTINSGERIGLVGRNGHGKTTLFRMILGEEHLIPGSSAYPMIIQSVISPSTYTLRKKLC